MDSFLHFIAMMTNVLPYRRLQDNEPKAWVRQVLIAILSSILIGIAGGLVGAYTMIISDNARIADQKQVNAQIFSELHELNNHIDALMRAEQ